MTKFIKNIVDVFDWLFRPESHRARVERSKALMIEEWEADEKRRGPPHHITPRGSPVWYVDESGNPYDPPWAECYRSTGRSRT